MRPFEVEQYKQFKKDLQSDETLYLAYLEDGNDYVISGSELKQIASAIFNHFHFQPELSKIEANRLASEKVKEITRPEVFEHDGYEMLINWRWEKVEGAGIQMRSLANSTYSKDDRLPNLALEVIRTELERLSTRWDKYEYLANLKATCHLNLKQIELPFGHDVFYKPKTKPDGVTENHIWIGEDDLEQKGYDKNSILSDLTVPALRANDIYKLFPKKAAPIHICRCLGKVMQIQKNEFPESESEKYWRELGYFEAKMEMVCKRLIGRNITVSEAVENTFQQANANSKKNKKIHDEYEKVLPKISKWLNDEMLFGNIYPGDGRIGEKLIEFIGRDLKQAQIGKILKNWRDHGRIITRQQWKESRNA